ncbi:Tat proofreading chaperone DmsD [Pasteurella canis]|uniref:Tat proofreading chaperone DmsD n=1 Tax=Pasteurella canis TaxID=753 RepID=UPI001CC1072E|nr:Tat proofreading chaperone DmsD [Pasteurella canis]UAX41700.1 Tat proofreading chaperone DmsD [Pasteurella canis]
MNTAQLEWISVSGRLLGSLFYYAPDNQNLAPIIDFFQQSDWQAEWQPTPSTDVVVKIEQGLLSEQLAFEYQHLFIGPNALIAPPWGSVYLDPESVIFGHSLLKLREFLRQHEIAFVIEQNEPEDHIGLMLMLAAYLAENHPELLNVFLAEHFLTWSTRYLQLMAAQQESAFYQGIALLTQLTLTDWQQQLAIEVQKTRLYR